MCPPLFTILDCLGLVYVRMELADDGVIQLMSASYENVIKRVVGKLPCSETRQFLASPTILLLFLSFLYQDLNLHSAGCVPVVQIECSKVPGE